MADWRKTRQPPRQRTEPFRRDGLTILVRRIGASLLTEFYRSYIAVCINRKPEDHGRALNAELGESLAAALLDDLAPSLASEPVEVYKSVLHVSHRHLHPNANAAQRSSSTGDSRNRHRVRGLHVDNWELPRLPISERARSGYKYIVNLGMEARYFLFVDVALSEIYRHTSREYYAEMAGVISNSSYASPIAEWFLAEFPSFPMSRILLEPGDGVLAPVQNVIHDGDLSSKMLADVVGMVSLRGKGRGE